MTALSIITLTKDIFNIPSSTLRIPSQDVDLRDETTMKLVKRLVEDMFETMYSSPWGGVGLAAPQVGVLWRLIVIDFEDEPIVAINPKIIAKSEIRETGGEVCLSLPFITADVERFETITVTFFDLSGVLQTKEETGFRAKVYQHEIDHLDGILYVDRLDAKHPIRAIDYPSVRATRKAMKAVSQNQSKDVSK